MFQKIPWVHLHLCHYKYSFCFMSGFHRAVGLILIRRMAYIPISVDDIALTA